MRPEQLDAVRKMERLIAQVRTSIDPKIPAQVVQTFLIVALNEGATVTEIAQHVGSNLSTVSRHLLDLGDYDRRQQPGYKLVERTLDPKELRKVNYVLTPKGRLLVDALARVMAD